MPNLPTTAEILAIIERHVDDAHRRMLRSVTDTMRFKTKSEKAQEERALKVLMAVLVEVHASGSSAERLLKESYDRIDGRTYLPSYALPHSMRRPSVQPGTTRSS